MIRRHYPAVLLCDLASSLGWRSMTLRRHEDGPERLAVPVADAAAALGFDPDDLAERLGADRIINQ